MIVVKDLWRRRKKMVIKQYEVGNFAVFCYLIGDKKFNYVPIIWIWADRGVTDAPRGAANPKICEVEG
jgi:hypothetical protein